MRLPSPRTFVIVGFSIALVSVLLNSVFLARTTSRIQAADAENEKLMRAMADSDNLFEVAGADMKLFLVLKNMAALAPSSKQQEVRYDAATILGDVLAESYAAANGIAGTELLKAQNEDVSLRISGLKRRIALLTRIKELERSNVAARHTEIQRLQGQLENTSDETLPPPSSELGKTIRQFNEFIEDEDLLKDETTFQLKLLPIYMPMVERWVETNRLNETRRAELQVLRSRLRTRASNITYAAIALQIFALMLILAKDLAKKPSST